ncbi:pyridoxamine 5'-phosphate oxidase family protein [Pontivivens ytuae]|uniref:Pyridoxamine 5'-phosphate oxidase family protein n=1 Tax=Pontivivens ytuae TaxID=2789856 RepID=A0A7S9LTH1_9RHOB|nr:pyridoxamine 5'-phosphate oxidase family protein [Pontivivens ytuae]QPH54991.1 pyridoxamine 5'-phosphate oxidase family protein [Pontivivens ytuae]
MSDLKLAKTDPEAQLWEQLADQTAGMLGLHGVDQHMQPMAHIVDRDAKALYFFTKKSTDLVRAMGPNSMAHFTLISDDHDYHACMKGPLVLDNDEAKIEKMWSNVVAAWYEQGKDDPDLALIRMDLQDAAIWASTNSSLKFGWEIAKANVKDAHQPEIGVTNHVYFKTAA